MTAAGARGRHKVFLGMAAGVGKTVRMLQEGRAAAAAGRVVAIGLLETHGRADTAVEAEGLEVIPRRKVVYRDIEVEEMDLPAILLRAPEVCLIDELAHTNPPGVEHRKRYEDIEDVLDAGIDVLSTMNVQHLESLNDLVAEMSGVRVRETVPDSVLQRADEIVLIDVTPEALLDRLRAGKVYPPERIDAALNNFFRIENLAALRETALRHVAEEIEQKRAVGAEDLGTRGEEDDAGGEARAAVGERLLALVRPRPSAQRLVRRAWRSSQRLGAELDVLWVRPPGRPDSDDQARCLADLRQLCSVLGATLLIEESDDLVGAAARVVSERGTTYVLMGESTSRRWLDRLREPLPQRLLRATPRGVDVRIVSERLRPPDGERP
ncbi:MAG: two-component system, OmpR family, sensor histidine kinase KdpD [Solirubrobacteraceae bacterium]|nr:two-component system, OmpR family, sensor histidine kinase KdpD [Solirubrobacteraceae bacterium]